MWWHVIVIKTRVIVGKIQCDIVERMKPSERKNEVYGQNSILERAKEWNQANVKTKRMIKIQSWSGWRNDTKRT